MTSPQQNGTTALLWAICWGHLETVQLLIRWGADINVPSAVSTPPSFLPFCLT
jgi:ankyrin repeat protein